MAGDARRALADGVAQLLSIPPSRWPSHWICGNSGLPHCATPDGTARSERTLAARDEALLRGGGWAARSSNDPHRGSLSPRLTADPEHRLADEEVADHFVDIGV